MAERARSFTVTVEIDSNKETYKRTFSWEDADDVDEVFDLARVWVDDVFEGMR